MKKTSKLVSTTLSILLLTTAVLQAEQPATFEQAKRLAAQTRRLLLIEFYRDD